MAEKREGGEGQRNEMRTKKESGAGGETDRGTDEKEEKSRYRSFPKQAGRRVKKVWQRKILV